MSDKITLDAISRQDLHELVKDLQARVKVLEEMGETQGDALGLLLDSSKQNRGVK